MSAVIETIVICDDCGQQNSGDDRNLSATQIRANRKKWGWMRPATSPDLRSGLRRNHMKPKFIDPINPYTGDVSILAIAKNIRNGFTSFPHNMGETKRKCEIREGIGPCDKCGLPKWPQYYVGYGCMVCLDCLKSPPFS